MILCPLPEFHRYTHLHPAFPAVEAFLSGPDLARLPEGRVDLHGDDLYVSSAPCARTRPASEAPLEAHRAYIDVQVVIEGTDTMGWMPRASCGPGTAPYDPARDIQFFGGTPDALIPVQAGQLVVFFPEDAHAPLIGDGSAVKKLVVKVRV